MNLVEYKHLLRTKEGAGSLSYGYRVLHVVESFGGGVASALEQYRSATPETEHHLLRTVRDGSYEGDETKLGFSSIAELPRFPLTAISAIRQAVKRVQPDVIHAHSSFAGAFVRVGMRARVETPIVYTPHGFSFERTDISPLRRQIFRVTEGALARNTTVFAACSQREEYLCRELAEKSSVVYVPNVASVPDTMPPVDGKTGTFTVVAVARVSTHKGPDFFAAVAREVGLRSKEIRFKWIGGGDEAATQRLRDAGVEVTGWHTREEAMGKLAAADVLLHTAAWDGFPMVLLEANQLGVPSLVRTIAPFESAPDTVKGASPSDLAEKVLSLAASEESHKACLETWDSYLSDNTPARQADKLMAAYRLAVGEDYGNSSNNSGVLAYNQ